MKRFSALISMLALVFSTAVIIGCGGDSGDSSDTTNPGDTVNNEIPEIPRGVAQ